MEKTKRKTIGNSKRFKVFERDGYTCRYCGNRPPEVTLEIDHFIPVKEGGDNSLQNLLTSCFSCNRGKKARISRSPDEATDYESIIVEKKEIIKQLKEITKYNNEIESYIDFHTSELETYWCSLHEFRIDVSVRGIISIRNFLRQFSPDKIREAMELSVIQTRGNTDTFRYMCGILQNWKKGINSKPTNSYE